MLCPVRSDPFRLISFVYNNNNNGGGGGCGSRRVSYFFFFLGTGSVCLDETPGRSNMLHLTLSANMAERQRRISENVAITISSRDLADTQVQLISLDIINFSHHPKKKTKPTSQGKLEKSCRWLQRTANSPCCFYRPFLCVGGCRRMRNTESIPTLIFLKCAHISVFYFFLVVVVVVVVASLVFKTK